MSKHTPGPWLVDDESQVIAGNRVIAQVFGPCEPSNCVDIDREWADARLISAAPELLEALRDMLAGWKYIRSMHGDLYGVGWDRAQGKAEAAWAKATGEQA